MSTKRSTKERVWTLRVYGHAADDCAMVLLAEEETRDAMQLASYVVEWAFANTVIIVASHDAPATEPITAEGS